MAESASSSLLSAAQPWESPHGRPCETAFGLRSAWINESRPTGTTWQNWTDWDLGTDRDANCQSVYIDVSFIVKVGANFDACETWDMTKSANGSNVSYKMEWKCNCWPYMGEVDREVAYSILVNVSQGATPRWTLGMGMAARTSRSSLLASHLSAPAVKRRLLSVRLPPRRGRVSS